jgi:transcriptional regulator with XRE-family HTH domain
MFPPEVEAHLTKRLGQELRAFRKDRGLTQEKFAECIGCSTRQLQDIESGQTATSFLFLFASLALMKDEQVLTFLAKIIPEVREALGIKPLRRGDTALYPEDLPRTQPAGSLWDRWLRKICS